MPRVNARDDDLLRRAERVDGQAEPSSSPWSGGTAGLERLIEVFQRRKWWVIGSIVLMTVLVALLTSQQEKKYTSTASLLFRDTGSAALNGGGAVIDPARQGATNDALVALPEVATRAARIAGQRATPGEVAVAIKVEPTGDSDVAKISATSTSPQRAALIANAYARAYVAFRRSLDTQQIDDAIDSVQAQINALRPDQEDSALAQSLRANLTELTGARALAGTSAQVVERAGVPSAPSSPNTRRNLILAILLGAIIGTTLAFLRDRIDHTLRTTGELEAVYRVPLLASIPRSRSRTAGITSAADTEAFRTLRANLRYFGVSRELKSILVSSPMAGDGKSTVASELAKTMAAMGDSVILIEADLHKTSAISPSAKVGLSSVLSGSVPLERAVISFKIDEGPSRGRQAARQLAVLPPGPVPPNAPELLESGRMSELLVELEDQFDRVIIDSPALMVVSDVRALVGQVSGVLIVSAVNHTRRGAAEAFREQVDLLGGHSLGFVANLVPPSRYGGDEYYEAN